MFLEFIGSGIVGLVGVWVGDRVEHGSGLEVLIGIGLWGLLERDVGKLANDAIRTQSRR